MIISAQAASQGFDIRLTGDSFSGDTLYLAQYYGNSQYIVDTTVRNNNDEFVFVSDSLLPAGMYMFVFPPENRFFQLLINKSDQNISVKLNPENPGYKPEIRGSKDSEVFYEYMNFLADLQVEADSLSKLMEASEDRSQKMQLEARMSQMDQLVYDRQNQFAEKYANDFVGKFIKAAQEVKIPELEGEGDNLQKKRYYYYKRHFFDNIDLADPRMIRTPLLFDRINRYMTKMTPGVPDSINASLDHILNQCSGAQDNYKFILIHYLNEFAASKYVGMDAVYVHLVLEYYAKGKAPWAIESNLKKMIDRARVLEPILVGKTAPNIEMLDSQKQVIRLHDVVSDYIVLYFWAPDCGHCKKSLPHMLEFSENFEQKGVKLFSVCSKLLDDEKTCWKYIDDNPKMKRWLNTSDPYLKSRYKQIYDVLATPMIYILDKDKKIISKKIGAEQLSDVMQRIIDWDKKKEINQ